MILRVMPIMAVDFMVMDAEDAVRVWAGGTDLTPVEDRGLAGAL